MQFSKKVDYEVHTLFNFDIKTAELEFASASLILFYQYVDVDWVRMYLFYDHNIL